MARIKLPTKQSRLLAKEILHYIRNDESIPPTRHAVRIADITALYIARHPRCLNRTPSALTAVLIKLWRHLFSYKVSKDWESIVQFYMHAAVACWLLDHSMRILLSLNPKLR